MINRISLFAAIALSALSIFSGCKQETETITEYVLTPVIETCTVTFHFYEGVKNVEFPVQLRSICPYTPEIPDRKGYRFFCWSSKLDNVSPIDLSTQRFTYNQDIYAVWLPEISDITEISLSGITLKTRLENPDLSWVKKFNSLKDCFMNATFETENDGYSTELNLKYQSSKDDIIKVSYNSGPSFDFTKTTTIKASVTGSKLFKKSVFKAEKTEESFVKNYETDDSYIKIVLSDENAKYTAVCHNSNGNFLAAKESSKLDDKNIIEFFGLPNNTPYNFYMLNENTNKYSELAGISTKIKYKKSSDILFIAYLAADNNLNDYIYLNMKEIERGLASIREKDGSTLSGKPSVNIVALWDGDSASNNHGISKAHTGIFELGGEYNDAPIKNIIIENDKKSWFNLSNYDILANPEALNLSSNTKNFSYTAANWLSQSINYSTVNKDFDGEINTADPNNIVNYLKWVNEHYEAEHVVLFVNDHGSGPRSLNRALCTDENSSMIMSSKSFGNALAASGYNSSNKLDVLVLDLCLGCSIEDCYEFRNYAEYLVSAPGNQHSIGLPYYSIISKLDYSILDSKRIADFIIEEHKEHFTNPSLFSVIGSNSKSPYDSAINFTSVKLDEIQELSDNISSLADYLINHEDYYKYLNGEEKYFLRCSAASTNNHEDNLCYKGTYTWLFDIGFFNQKMQELSNDISDNEMNELCAKINESLLKTISSSYRCGYYYDENNALKGSRDLYKALNKDGKNYYGLTISGESSNFINAYPSYYQYELDFGRNFSWYYLLKKIFPAQR